jgi:hypothetical protein
VAAAVRLRRRRATRIAASHSGPLDRLLVLPDCELDIARVVEGACSFFHGVPLDACPWPRNYPEHWQGWRRGWIGAALYSDYYEQDDADKWLCQTTNATD